MKTLYSGQIFRILSGAQPNGKNFEIADRAPGVRAIIVDKRGKKVLLTREKRHELGGNVDWRLPGGKVFDTLTAYEQFEASHKDIEQACSDKVIEEVRQEAGILATNPRHFFTSHLGATVHWDLYFFEISEWELHPAGQQLINGDDHEDITVSWVSLVEAERLALEEMKEERAALVLLRWLHQRAA